MSNWIPIKLAEQALDAKDKEIAGLNAEVKELKFERVHDLNHIGDLQAENARLKAEVERLTNNCDYLDHKLDEELDKSAMLCGQVERLRKAGDAIALDYAEHIEIEAGETAKTLMKTLPVLREWNAAKEGKQP